MPYGSGWTSIVNLDTGQEVSDSLDTAFGNIDTALTDIETKTDDFETRISSIENGFNFARVTSKTIAGTTYEEIVKVAYSYILGNNFFFTFNLNTLITSTAKTFTIRYSIDSGTTWTEQAINIEDNLIGAPISYSFPVPFAAASAEEFIIQAKKSNVADTLSFKDANVIAEKK